MWSILRKENIINEKGYVTLISVLIMGAIGLAITISLILLGLSSSRTSFSLEKSNQAASLSNTCADEGLEKLRRNPAFLGTVNLNFSYGDCTYVVTDLGGASRRIDSTGTTDDYTRKVQITLDQISPSINITSWQEVADF